MNLAPRWRRRVCGLAAAAVTGALLTVPTLPAEAASTTVLVNEVYGGGGNSGAPYSHDFIELRNVSDQPIDVTGWSVEYYSSSGSSGGKHTLTGTIPAGGTFLVQEAKGAGGGTSLPTPDSTGNLAMSGTNGSVQLFDASGSPVDLVGYGSAAKKEGTATPALSNTTSASRAGTTDTDDNSADFTVGAPTPQSSAADPGPTDPPTGPSPDCGADATLIHDVQGPGDASPLAGTSVAIEGRVVGVKPGLSGYFVQEEAAQADSDPATSEGVFVYDKTNQPAVDDHVRVVGAVSEYNGLTEVTASDFSTCGTLPHEAPTDLTFPADSLEPYEGMDVRLADEMVVSEYYNYGRYGQVVLGKPLEGDNRLWQPTQIATPGPEAQALAEKYADRVITVDDNSTAQNPSVLPSPENGQPFGLDNLFRGGDRVQGTSGPLTYSFGDYMLEPNTYGDVTYRNSREPAPTSPAGTDVRVASANVLNYFVTLDDGQPHCGPNGDMDCRGANTAEEFRRQQDKIVAEIGEMDADVVGLMEIENTQGVDAVGNLVQALNDRYGAGTYAAIDTGVLGGDAIKVGLIYQPAAVSPKGDFAVLDSSDDPRYDSTKNRAMLTQSFTSKANDGVFSVSVAHLKSKGSACDGDPDTGDGQGNCNQTRTRAVQAITDYLAGDPTGSGDPDQLVIGDMNAYAQEDPIQAFQTADYADLAAKFHGLKNYSYVFDGLVGSLDHAMSSPSLTDQVLATDEWHTNADEASVLDYNMDFKPPAVDAIYAPDAYRSSDHDPLVVSLDVAGATTPPAPQEPTVTVGTKPDHVVFGGQSTLSGTVTDASGQPVAQGRVTLQRRLAGTTEWTSVTSKLTGADGSYSFILTPAKTTEFRVVYAGDGSTPSSASEVVTLEVAPRVTLSSPPSVQPGRIASFWGTVAPAKGQTVVLQRRVATGWVAVDEGTVRTDGSYALSWKAPAAAAVGPRAFRAYVPAAAGLTDGQSGVHTVQVVR